ncbi:hypothetical protein LINPERHAP1_LOCUS21757 [Linum perenne]
MSFGLGTFVNLEVGLDLIPGFMLDFIVDFILEASVRLWILMRMFFLALLFRAFG